MPISINEVVSITPRVLSGGASGLNFNGLFITKSEVAPVDTLLNFSNSSDVAKYFGYESEQYKAAEVYFNGYNNSLTKPRGCFFFRHLHKDAKAFLRGSPAADPSELLKELNKVKSGSINLVLGPDELVIEGLNFSACNSLSDCALVLQDAINDAGLDNDVELWKTTSVNYSSLTTAFTIQAGLSGDEIAIDFASGPLADLMNLSKAAKAITSRGGAQRSYKETLDKVLTYTANFVSYATIEEVTSIDEARQLAQWANQKFNEGSQFLYIWHTADLSLNGNNQITRNSQLGFARVGSAMVVNFGAGAEIAKSLVADKYQGVCGVYGDARYAAFIMGAVASIDWMQPNSTITFALKSQAGLPANVSDTDTARKLTELKLTFLGDYASRNDQFKLTANGMVYGDYRFIDTYINSTWFNNALQTKIVETMSQVGRLPYNQEGYDILRLSCQPVFNAAKLNGVIDSGVTIDEQQRETLKREAGKDIASTLQNNGYYMQILDADANTRGGRTSPPCQVWYTYGGSIHKLNVPVTTVA